MTAHDGTTGTPPLRVLHFPTLVGGNPGSLARAERRLGARSTVAAYERAAQGYDVDVDLGLDVQGRPRRLLTRLGFAARSLHRYDVFHFNFGQTLLPRLGAMGLDLPLLRAVGKRVFMTFQGCDARQVEYCRQHFDISCCGGPHEPGLCDANRDRTKANSVTYARRFCHRTFCVNPDLMHVVPGAEFVPYANVDLDDVRPLPFVPRDRTVIVHAPTSRAIKGTQHVLDAKAALARPDVEWRFVEGVSHDEAMQQFRDADIVIDQLKIGWYGGFAVEMMAMGKPVVCYIRDEDLRFIPAAMAEELPIVRATARTLGAVVRRLIDDPAERAEIGARSRAYVERWHDPARIAARMLAVYRTPARSFWADDAAEHANHGV